MSFSGFDNEDKIIEALNGKTFELLTVTPWSGRSKGIYTLVLKPKKIEDKI